MRHLLPTTFALAGLALAGPAGALTLDFEGFLHGEPVSSAGGVAVNATNLAGGPNLALAFDSTARGTADPDLEGPSAVDGSWAVGSLAPSTVLGNLLILAENDVDMNGDGLVDDPDDEGGRPAGVLELVFQTSVLDVGLDLVDVDSATAEAGTVELWAGSTLLVSVAFADLTDPLSPFFQPLVVFGDNSANRIDPIDAGGTPFDRVVVRLGGSGGIDNVRATEAVPEPATAGLLATAVLLLAARRLRGARPA